VRSEIEAVAVHEPTRYMKKVYRSGALVGAVLVGDLREAGRLMAEASGNNPTLT
jgi:NAD(P)H-nitrite reductase large subunit